MLARIISCMFLTALSWSCTKDPEDTTKQLVTETPEISFIKGVDASFLPEMESENIVFYNRDGQKEDMLTTLKNNGVNTIRIRLWKNPVNKHSGFDEVKQFSDKVKSKGLKVWITIHYSDTWADPGSQITPNLWKVLSINQLKDSVYAYSKKIAIEINPDFVQIGNEINNGFIHPQGKFNEPNFVPLLIQGVLAFRKFAPKTQIMLHYAGVSNYSYFFEKVKIVDYDIIGLSYYPIWHGKDLLVLKNNLNNLSVTYGKKIVIAETSYPFTFDWNDWTNNIIGSEEQVLSDYPATPEGQKRFLAEINQMIKQNPSGLGVCYWGGEWVSFKGKESKKGSSWENQALYDFNNKALPAMEVFK